MPGGSEFCSGKGWVALPSPSLWDFPWHLPLLVGVGKPQPDLFHLGWFDNPKGHGDDGKGFRASCFLPITLLPLAPFSAGTAGEGLLEELPAERLVSGVLVSSSQFCQLGQSFLVLTSASLGNGNAVNPHSSCLFSVVYFSHVRKQVWCSVVSLNVWHPACHSCLGLGCFSQKPI